MPATKALLVEPARHEPDFRWCVSRTHHLHTQEPWCAFHEMRTVEERGPDLLQLAICDCETTERNKHPRTRSGDCSIPRLVEVGGIQQAEPPPLHGACSGQCKRMAASVNER